jgi:hypothetical protein
MKIDGEKLLDIMIVHRKMGNAELIKQDVYKNRGG